MNLLEPIKKPIEENADLVKKLVVATIIPILVYVGCFFLFVNYVGREELVVAAETRADEQSIQIDAIMRSVDRQAISASLDYNIQQYLYGRYKSSDKEMESYLMGLAKSIDSTNNIIHSVYIWLGAKENVILPYTSYSTKNFFDYGWTEYIEDLQYSNYVFTPCRTISDISGGKEVISGIWAIRPQTTADKLYNFVVINFDKDKLLEKIHYSIDSDEELFILNGSGVEVTGRGQKLTELSGSHERSGVNRNRKGQYSDNGKYIETSIVSTYTDWTYLLLSEIHSPILPNRAQVFRMLQGLVVWIIIMFSISAYLVLKKYYRNRIEIKDINEEERNFCIVNEKVKDGAEWKERRYYFSAVKYNLIVNNLKSQQFAEARREIESVIEELKAPLLHGRFYSNSKNILYLLLDAVIQAMRECKYKQISSNKKIEEIYEEMNSCKNMHDAELLLINTFEMYQESVKNEEELAGYADPVKIMVEYINENYDKDINLKIFSEMTHFSESHLSRMFKNSMGENYRDYLMKRKIEAGKTMLEETNMKVGEIAKKLSFNDSKTFIRAFEKYEKVTPGKYRHNIKIKEENDACDRKDTM